MKNSKDIIKDYNKKTGQGSVSTGINVEPCKRLPTGLFDFDLALGGGFPLGRVSVIYGPQSSCKTTIALKAVSTAQKLFPEKKAVYIDAEHALDGDWAYKLGVDVESLIVAKPPTADIAADMVYDFALAEDVSIIVLDSIAALATQNELESDSIKMIVGGAAMMVNKMFRKVCIGIGTYEGEGYAPTVIFINQIRYKAGQLFGNPEVMPGGKGQEFIPHLVLRISSKPITNKSLTVPVEREVKTEVKKNKIPVNAYACLFQLTTVEHDGFKVGETNDWNSLLKKMQAFNMIKNVGGKNKYAVRIFKKRFPTYNAIRDYIYADAMRELKTKEYIIEKASIV